MPYAVTKDNVACISKRRAWNADHLPARIRSRPHNWEPQMRYFSRGHRCITYSARGYTPSDVPPSADVYTYEHFYTDALAVLDHLESQKRISSGFQWAPIRRCRSGSTRRSGRCR